LTVLGSELDIVWQGYKLDNTEGDGTYHRYYGLGDDSIETIQVNVA
jgi:hypothetical protein